MTTDSPAIDPEQTDSAVAQLRAAFAVGHARRKVAKTPWAGVVATWPVAICAVPAMLSEGTTTKGTPAADLGAARYP